MSDDMKGRRQMLFGTAAVGAAFLAGPAAAADEKKDKAAGPKKEAFAKVTPIFKAEVWGCRSFDKGIYLKLADGIHGWHVTDNPYLFAIAAAAEAAKQPVFVQYSGYDPNWGNGAGYFQVVNMALFDWVNG